ncbi:MAG: LuxR C-terminal-related transcriptional regulator [Sulfuricurvum sp.]|uniref:response regulator transcription factor n=1 Tax=Sulfuricurvum sp. TaxID=2025608 RepID=UPI00262B82A6|nr:LuxR C-terminal-related transcriptional regulator [Sulfuricurvum sp.]MDD2828995.1 LuxR C-terminal-related transcriptional regulator [Sulfuricurvum sp.]MDD4950094.1 LuxR C-terminal-related transcriptional regulator [Sulfuricurvum sp.]
MKLYLVTSSESIMNHWSKALKKYHPMKIHSMNELNCSTIKGIILCQDTDIDETKLHDLLNNSESRLMIFSMLPDFLKAQQYLSKGVVGYGNAMMHESHIQSAYQAIEEGKIWLYPDFISGLITQLTQVKPKNIESHEALEKLSHREKEVALLLAQGLTHNEIAEDLNITVRTIKAHCTSIYEKLAIKDRLALSVLLHS